MRKTFWGSCAIPVDGSGGDIRWESDGFIAYKSIHGIFLQKFLVSDKNGQIKANLKVVTALSGKASKTCKDKI